MFQWGINIEGHKLKTVQFFCLISCLLLLLSESVSGSAGKSKQVGSMLFDSKGTA